MWISKAKVRQIPPYRDEPTAPLEFCPGFNLIRGKNGTGKTTILEALALLGHCNLFRAEQADADSIFQANLCVELVVTSEEMEQLRRLIPQLDSLAAPGSKLRRDWCQPSILQPISEALKELQSGDQRIRLGLELTDSGQKAIDLKELLCDETELSSRVKLLTTDMRHARIVQLLVAIGRPEIRQNAKASSYFSTGSDSGDSYATEWHPTIRQALIDQVRLGSSKLAVPGFIGYFHTDMYRWGLGNDIRESPKELYEHSLPLMLHERLKLFPARDHALIHNFTTVQTIWNRIISSRKEGRGISQIRLGTSDTGRTTVIVSIDQDVRNMISSGENQALFLAVWTLATEARRSCLLLDEPELHLSPGAAHRSILFLQALSHEYQTQIICASHALVIPREARGPRNEKTRLFYLPGPKLDALEGDPAVEEISGDFQDAIDELLASLRPHEAPNGVGAAVPVVGPKTE